MPRMNKRHLALYLGSNGLISICMAVSLPWLLSLCTLFGPTDGVCPLAAARMQRWALILGAFSYKVEYIPSSANSCADYLSHLPVPSTNIHLAEKRNEIHATVASIATAKLTIQTLK